ncbi:MAG: hotdog fold thioesterase [Chitinophagaceae bacterium]|nr:hotdog fold thioesterase [Chitinophagaceae bacterium]MBL0334383.1 hotdog fold thioesterase [Chitinophagaceae bacterium]
MAIWFESEISLDHLGQLGKGTMGDFLGIEWLELGSNFLKASMPVNEKTCQPYGLLHGGASCVLAETVGSVASALCVNHNMYYCVGLEINANHLRSVKVGNQVFCVVRPLHIGKNTHVWDIRISDKDESLVCISRLTVAVIPRSKNL